MGIEAESSWFSRATSNRAFFHGTLLLGATYRALTAGATSLFSTECYTHQTEAIRHIIASFESPETQLQEGTVDAVACLAAFEVRDSITCRKFPMCVGSQQNSIQWLMAKS